jgi:hypothetical protein
LSASDWVTSVNKWGGRREAVQSAASAGATGQWANLRQRTTGHAPGCCAETQSDTSFVAALEGIWDIDRNHRTNMPIFKFGLGGLSMSPKPRAARGVLQKRRNKNRAPVANKLR